MKWTFFVLLFRLSPQRTSFFVSVDNNNTVNLTSMLGYPPFIRNSVCAPT
jgi:hypothetical protein